MVKIRRYSNEVDRKTAKEIRRAREIKSGEYLKLSTQLPLHSLGSSIEGGCVAL